MYIIITLYHFRGGDLIFILSLVINEFGREKIFELVVDNFENKIIYQKEKKELLKKSISQRGRIQLKLLIMFGVWY